MDYRDEYCPPLLAYIIVQVMTIIKRKVLPFMKAVKMIMTFGVCKTH